MGEVSSPAQRPQIYPLLKHPQKRALRTSAAMSHLLLTPGSHGASLLRDLTHMVLFVFFFLTFSTERKKKFPQSQRDKKPNWNKKLQDIKKKHATPEIWPCNGNRLFTRAWWGHFLTLAWQKLLHHLWPKHFPCTQTRCHATDLEQWKHLS